MPIKANVKGFQTNRPRVSVPHEVAIDEAL
jgi:hypothetical protein